MRASDGQRNMLLMTKRAARRSIEKMRDYRARLRAAGLRPLQIWVPDLRRPGLREEARRQSRLASASADEAEVLSFLDAAAQDLLDDLPPA